MDYPEWVERVLHAAVEERRERAAYFVLFAQPVIERLGFVVPLAMEDWTAGPANAVLDAMEDLQRLDLMGNVSAFNGVQVTHASEEADTLGLRAMTWPATFAEPVTPATLDVLRAIVLVCHKPGPEFATLEWAEPAEVGTALGRSLESFEAQSAFQEALRSLYDHGLIRYRHPLVTPTYRGVVRAIGNEQWRWEEVLRGRQAEWERPYTEFKVALDLGTERGKEKLVRSCVALANTRAEPAHLLTVGFDPDTHEFTTSVDPAELKSDRVENLLTAYAAPVPDVVVRHVRFGHGLAGVVEVLREPGKLPYAVSRRIGKTEPGPLVRHGTHNEPPTDAELAALVAEGIAARS